MYLTKIDFLNYFRYPSLFWFLKNEEVEDFFSSENLKEVIDELSFFDQLKLLKLVTASHQTFASENFFKLNQIKDKKLIEAYRKIFSFPALSLYDYSSFFDDNTDDILKMLADPTLECAFLYKPKLIKGKLKATPTAIYKYNGKIYLIEHFWSTNLKKESLGIFIFYDYFFKKYLNFKVDQFLISFLSPEPSENKELLVNVGNSLPFTSLKRVPKGACDEKMNNINPYFNLDMEYRNSLYEKIFTEDEYESINVEDWEIEDELNNPQLVIDELLSHEKISLHDVDIRNLMVQFLQNKSNWIPPSISHYKSIFQHFYPSLEYSSKVVSLVKSLETLLSLKSEIAQNEFLKYTSNMEFLINPNEKQEYIVFEDAIKEFKKFKTAKTKVYYDFETISVPFPVLNNSKPYMQIVLQMSLIVISNGVEQKPVLNLIVDPLEISVQSFKQIIDSIYLDVLDVVYVVYNKTFENSRLKEMAELIGEDEYVLKVTEIIDKTVDLSNWFFYGNNPYIIHRQLRGFNSIKKVNKLIPREILELTQTKNYDDFERCKNGVMAQTLLLNRFLASDAKQDEKNWEKNKKFMVDYCENDVRSMIAVEMYIDQLLLDNKLAVLDSQKFKKIKLKHKKNPCPFCL